MQIATLKASQVAQISMAYMRANIDALENVLGITPTSTVELDAQELNAAYVALTEQFARHPASQKTWFQPGTPVKLASVLEKARRDDTVVRLFFGDPETGKDSLQEWDVTGFVGRTNGTFQTPILCEAYATEGGGLRSSPFGDVIRSRSVLRVLEVLTQKVLYQHPRYVLPDLRIEPASAVEAASKFPYAVVHAQDGKDETVANFQTTGDAHVYIGFMQGKCIRPFRTKAQMDAGIKY